ncbi:MAG: DNA mismatch repair protein MutL [Flavobacteriales bacterium]|jgi:DNA mismatch repair protein MutL
MSDIIQLLPDAVANQIAAGEVIQRPASVVKELVENAIDAGGTSIKLIIRDSGRTLIQVVDDGCGMSELDARMCFEKHATSKIKSAADLFAIRTKGFRGEALASVAAVAQVELKTRLTGDELGIHISIADSVVNSQEPCQTHEGSSFIVKNLFYNVPARRQFLKSDTVEFRHIVDEFERVALVHADVAFQLIRDDNEVFNLPPSSPRQRIVGVFGQKFNQRLVPVEESTDFVSVEGFVGKPEFARKSRGEQFFFVNKRFIRSSYFNHAVNLAYEALLPKGMHPFFALYLEIDPETIDVNVHPTKTEIKFRDERAVYSVIHAATRRALGRFNVSPSLDFEQEMSIKIDPPNPNKVFKAPSIKINPNYNPFDSSEPKTAPNTVGSGGLAGRYKPDSLSAWETMYEVVAPEKKEEQEEMFVNQNADGDSRKPLMQMHKQYVVTPLKSGLMVIDQQLAHERVLFEKNLSWLDSAAGPSQQLLFPETISLSMGDYGVISEHLDAIRALGFDIEDFGGQSFKVNGIPADSKNDNAQSLMESLIGQIIETRNIQQLEPRQELALSMARTTGIKRGMAMSAEEMHHLVDELFACQVPNYCPAGSPTIATFTLEEILQKFQ